MKHTFATALLLLASLQMNAQTLAPGNVNDVLKAMTLEEKANLLVGFSHSQPADGGNGILGQHADLVPGAAGSTHSISRLGIPVTVLSDGPAGLRIQPTRKNDTKTYYCTGFPVGTCLASTWNTELVTNVGKAIGNEVLEYGADVLLAPGMNIHRNPLCGRNFEYFSEDPVVTGKISAAYVNGIQSNGVGTSIKHFAGNSQETNRMGNDAVMSQRALREIYLKGFEIAVKEASPWTVMSSYNKINGNFTQEDRELLTTILRDEWGFKGIVMTDWTGKRNTAAQVHAGNDLMEPGTSTQIKEIIDKVNSGELSMKDVDICAKRILEYIIKTPRFKGYKYSNTPDLKAHAEVTRHSATEGMVLLKNNNGVLPLKNVKNVALFGITSYDFIAGGTGSGDVNKAYVVDLQQGLSGAGYKVNQDLKDIYEKYKAYQEAKIASERGGNWFWGKPKLDEMPIAQKFVAKRALDSDIAIITIGRNAGEGADRKIDNDFNLNETERQMLNDVCDAFHAQGKKVVVIMNIGGVIETASWKNLPDAILLAWQPGQEGGNSVADIISGKANPSGKLTMTFPLSCIDHPSSVNFPINLGEKNYFSNAPLRNDDYTLYNEGIYVGYRYFQTANKEVSYPFGYGMSYTSFDYSGAKVNSAKDGFTVTVNIKNTGKVAGKEVVELYVSAPKGGIEKPESELKAFAKTRELKPGESQTIILKVDNYSLASFDTARQAWVSAAGKYNIKIGSSVKDIRANGTYSLSKENVVKVHDVMKPNMKLDEISLK